MPRRRLSLQVAFPLTHTGGVSKGLRPERRSRGRGKSENPAQPEHTSPPSPTPVLGSNIASEPPPPSMFGHPNAPDLSKCLFLSEDTARLRYWQAKAEHYEAKSADLGRQLAFSVHAMNLHVRESKVEMEALNDRLLAALGENHRLECLLEASLMRSREFEVVQEGIDSMAHALSLCMDS